MSVTSSSSSVPVVGIVGAGQLARMTIAPAIALGVPVRLLAARADDGAALVSPNVLVGPPDSFEHVSRLARECDVLTFDHELVDVEQLERLEAAGHRLAPSASVMAVAQDKRLQRERFDALALPIPPYRHVRDEDDLVAFAAEFGWPVVAKARRGGYDGRGVWLLDGPETAGRLVEHAASAGLDLLAEQWAPIERELAVLVARRPGGQAVTYPVVETVQRDGICHEVLAPASLPPAVAERARSMALNLADRLDVTGILAVEMFFVRGDILINEIATRPHNSGHFSIEGCATSQFENHLRAILDWPLGPTRLIAPAVATVNVLGAQNTVDLAAALPAALEIEGVHVHLYGKEPRPGRKIGHVTALGDDLSAARQRAWAAAALLAEGVRAEARS